MRHPSEHMDQYAAEQAHPGTRLMHLVGVPMLVVSLPPLVPPLGAGPLLGRWALQLTGHCLFGKRRP